MKHYAGLDVSLEQTSICVVDEAGAVVREAKVASDPEAIVGFFADLDLAVARIGLEAGPLSQWLHDGLAGAGLAVICVETRHMRGLLSATLNKTDRNDARGIAQMMRAGLYRTVHVKTLASQETRALLSSRKFLVRKLRDLENDIRGTLRNFGLKVGAAGRQRFEARILELVRDRDTLEAIMRPMLRVRAALIAEYGILHKRMLDIVRDDPVCRRLMTVPGVGPVVALSFRTAVDVPARFSKSKTVGAHFGLTPRRFQSGEIDRTGRISKCGDDMVRTALYEAANILLTRVGRWSWLKGWAMAVAKRRGMHRAKVALARRLGVILHRMWLDRTDFRWTRTAHASA